ncbi:conserved hypothetical protein [Vibrio nigripulchritudo SOn1]|uniref:Uncharacterized protein n=1 Tax=Vibrio nigripulchritudo SOn1 TaxID=1238450 RepID=A0AAV2VJ53_9VIBR|nr:hypothetical protein [Vibrio nigripulchritudo]CCO44668.1 conserved hypothetical protein [Vibrio nigripulchritudo SOn1]
MAHKASPNGEAERLLNHPLIHQILDDLERDALDAIINTNDERHRAEHVWEVRSIRSLRQKLKTLAEGKTILPKKGTVA